MRRSITSVTLLSFLFILTACINKTTALRPPVKTPIERTTRTSHPVSLGTPISTNTHQTNRELPIIQEFPIDEENRVYSREEEDNEMNLEEEEVSTEILSTKEEATEIEEMQIETIEANTNLPTEPSESSKSRVETNPYGAIPENYRTKIRNYLAKKANPAYSLKYIFSRPQKAYKNDKSWQGWIVQVDVLKRNGRGEILKNQPYTILFNNSTILEDIADDNPKNITKVIY